MSNLFYSDIQTVAKKIKNKEISPVELVSSQLKRIEHIDSKINAFITVLKEVALGQAEIAEKEIMSGNYKGPLHGVPIAIKDIFETKGLRSTSGSKVFASWLPNKDAEVVKYLNHSGAIIVGKTNLSEFALGSTTENYHYGNTHNPWNLNKIPGGSSGGSAAATASGMCFGALGTDTGGSIRLPSAICGVVGFKPTFNLVNRTGCFPLSSSLDHVGPITRTVSDSEIWMETLLGEKKAKDLNIGEWNDSVIGIRLAVCRDYFFDDLDPSVEKLMDETIGKLKTIGIEVVEINIDGLTKAIEAQKTILGAEAIAVHKPILDKEKEMYGPETAYRLENYKNITAVEYLDSQRIRAEFISEVLSKTAHFDGLITPTNSITPYDINSNPIENGTANIFNLGKTPLFNLLGFPTLSIPCGFTDEKMPVGFQLVGKPYSDGQILGLGKTIETLFDWQNKLVSNEQQLVKEEKLL
ncbi:amidase [Terrilactibacillus laevilacticus]|uniref:Amidase n=1 Tax=Terrilactibacillus laevilacticus TaxID=1380157 RepID=A0ABW5PN49_9BACI|nr:amidase [Terrilactibacillus laevilacticus]